MEMKNEGMVLAGITEEEAGKGFKHLIWLFTTIPIVLSGIALLNYGYVIPGVIVCYCIIFPLVTSNGELIKKYFSFNKAWKEMKVAEAEEQQRLFELQKEQIEINKGRSK